MVFSCYLNRLTAVFIFHLFGISRWKTERRNSWFVTHGKKRNFERMDKAMTLEQLMAMGLTEEQAKKVMESLDGNFVTKSRFNEVNTELKQSKETVKKRDEQLEELKKSDADAKTLQEQIEKLQAENKAKDEAHQKEITQLKFDGVLTAALSAAKAKNPETVKPLLKAFLEKAVLDGEEIKGLDDELKRLSEAEETKWLFDAKPEQDSKPGFRGMKPGENANKQIQDGGSTPKTLADAVKAAYETNK